MKIALLSDIHLLVKNPVCRKDDLTQEQFNKISFVIDYAINNNLVVFQAGDLTDKPRSWHLYSWLLNKLKEDKTILYSIYGQHNMYYRNRTATLLELLIDDQKIIELEKDFIEFTDFVEEETSKVVHVYGCSFGDEIPKVQYTDKKYYFNVLVIHAPISDKALPYSYINAKRFLKENKDYNLILCGDIHRKFEIWDKDRCIVNTGCMLRKDSTEESYNHKPCFAVFDTCSNEMEWVEIPHKPAKDVISKEHILKQEKLDNMLNDFVEEVNSDFEVEFDFNKNLLSFIENNDVDDDVVKLIEKEMED